MKAGNLVRIKSTSTGDRWWAVKLYRERTPVLLVRLAPRDKWATILDTDGKQKTLRRGVLEVVSY